MKHVAFTALAFAALAAPALAQQSSYYGPEFYRAYFWSGEYPAGFTVLEDTVLKLRPAIDPNAEATIDCPLKKGATYHSWNIERSNEDGLAFVSFTAIDEMEVTQPVETVVYGEIDSTETTLSLKPGDKWRYLVYFAEGTFLMEYDGVTYVGDQSFPDASKSTLPADKQRYDEWLRINCSNNQWGWYFMADLAQNAALGSPNIVEYGRAADVTE